MRLSWLADADANTSWAHLSWQAFASWKDPTDTPVVLPVHGLMCTGATAPLDLEELLGSPVIKNAVRQVSSRFRVLVLPPLRHTLAPKGPGVLGIDFETAWDQILGIARGVREAGFRKLVFINTSSASEPLVSMMALEARAAFGLDCYVIQTRELGLKPGTEGPTSDALAGILTEIRLHRSAPLSSPPPLAEPNSTPAPFLAPFPGYRPFYLPSYSRERLRSMPNRHKVRIIQPVASIEQHGPHLPVGVDSILGQALLDTALSDVDPISPQALVLPPLCYGKSNEHAGFPGTLSVDAKTLRRILITVSHEVAALGFSRLSFFNTHGGNRSLLELVIREINEERQLSSDFLNYPFEPELNPQEKAWGMHADEWETSLMLACAPHLVSLDKAVCEYPARIEDPGYLKPEKSPVTFAWQTRDLSKSGVLGNAPAATLEKGKDWLAAAAASLKASILE